VTQIRRNRTISLRLSEEEYAVLHAQYPHHGARSVSDLARVALQRLIAESPASQAGVAAKVYELDHRMNAVEAELARLLEREKVMA
jgi:hypothetical protein